MVAVFKLQKLHASNSTRQLGQQHLTSEEGMQSLDKQRKCPLSAQHCAPRTGSLTQGNTHRRNGVLSSKESGRLPGGQPWAPPS